MLPRSASLILSSLGTFSPIMSSIKFSSLLSFWNIYSVNVSMLDIVPKVSSSFKNFFLFLFRLGDFYYTFLQFADSFFCILKSTLDSL